jgi:hypothetical protein
MSTVYFAKFNFNEKIYDLYHDSSKFEILLNRVYTNMTTETELTENTKKKTINYKFIQLIKDLDTLTVNGRLVAYSPGTHVTYDPERDDIIETNDDKKASFVTFSFNIRSEIIGFVPKNDFGRNQFIERFKNLVDETCDVGEVELFLESDKRELEEKFERFERIDELSVLLIPPNNEQELFEDLFDLNPQKLNETGANKFLFGLKGVASKGLNSSSKYVKDFIKGVTLGYGILKASGVNTSGERFSVQSNKDALYFRPIDDKHKDNIPIIEEKTKAGINQINSFIALVKEDIKEEKKNSQKG